MDTIGQDLAGMRLKNGVTMELVKKFRTKFIGALLACALLAPTIALGMEQKQKQEKTYGHQDHAYLIHQGSQMLTPYLMDKMGYDSQKSYPAMIGQAFLTPTVSYLAWEGLTWLTNKFGSREETIEDQDKSEVEKINVRNDARTKVITGGISNMAAIYGIKVLRTWLTNNNSGSQRWWSKLAWWGVENIIITEFIAPLIVNTVYNRLFPAKIMTLEKLRAIKDAEKKKQQALNDAKKTMLSADQQPPQQTWTDERVNPKRKKF
jgi:hypothetical protein